MFDLKKILKDALSKIAQDKIGEPLSAEDREELGNMIEQIAESPADDDYEDSDEIKAILREESIERLTGDIRYIVTGYIEIKHNPFPYAIKRNLPDMRASHSRILHAEQDLLNNAILRAERDLFRGEFRVVEHVKEYRNFFDQYTTDPSGFELDSIKSYVADKYQADIEALF